MLTRVPGASPSSPPAEVVVFGTNHLSRQIADDVFRAIMGEQSSAVPVLPAIPACPHAHTPTCRIQPSTPQWTPMRTPCAALDPDTVAVELRKWVGLVGLAGLGCPTCHCPHATQFAHAHVHATPFPHPFSNGLHRGNSMCGLMVLSGRNPLPTELVYSTPVVARPRTRGAGSRPGYPGCWVQVNPLVRGDRPFVEASNAQRSARVYSDTVLVKLMDPRAAGGVGGAGTEGAQAGTPVPRPPLRQPRSHSGRLQLRQPPQGMGGDPDLRTRLSARQHDSIRTVREAYEEGFKRALASNKTVPRLTTLLSSNPLTAGFLAVAAWFQGAWRGQAREWGCEIARQCWLDSPRPSKTFQGVVTCHGIQRDPVGSTHAEGACIAPAHGLTTALAGAASMWRE